MTHVAYEHGTGVLRLSDHAGPRRRLICGAGDLDADAVFERVPLSHGRIALRTLTGEFLHIAPDDGLSFGLYTTTGLAPEGTFEEILWPDGCVSLRTNDLTFVTIDDDGTVQANRTGCQDAGRLTMRPVGKDQLPGHVPAEITTLTQVRRVVSMPRQPGPADLRRARTTFGNA